MAQIVHRALDRWTLKAIDDHLQDYFVSGRDSGSKIGFPTAQPLRLKMLAAWQLWLASLYADPTLLARFLQLLVCAVDDDESIEMARVLVGRVKIGSLIRGTAVALAIAVGWETVRPHLARPGNLLRERAGAAPWTGHSCAADQIDGKAISLCAASFMWQTQFVILSVRGSIDFTALAEEFFSTTQMAQPGFSEPDGSGQIIMSIDTAFVVAMAAGVAALGDLLASVQSTHFEKLGRSIVRQFEEEMPA